MNFIMMICSAAALLVQLWAVTGTDHPKGHLEYIGSHQPPEGPIDEVEGYLEPEVFFEQYVKANRPILFKGAAKSLPAYQKWNDSYLHKNYGGYAIEAEKGKKENRSSGVKSMTVSQFLETYQEENIYMVQDVFPDMYDEVLIPKSIRCGGFTDLLQMAVLWFSSGGTKSVLHVDESDNINCLLDGQKELIFIKRGDGHKLRQYPYDIEKGFSKMDVEKVDMYKFPVMRDMKYWKANMDKGDCLFIPVEWLHHVSSLGPRNLAVNLWFAHMRDFNPKDCEQQPTKAATLADHNMSEKNLFRFAENIEYTPYQVFHDFADVATVTQEEFQEKYKERAEPPELRRVYHVLDTDHDGQLTWDEIEECPVRELMESFPFMKPSVPFDEAEMYEDEAEEEEPGAGDGDPMDQHDEL